MSRAVQRTVRPRSEPPARDVPGSPQLALGIERGGAVLDAINLVGPATVAHELRRVGVDHVGVAGDVAAAQRAERAQLGVGPPVGIRRAVELHAILERWVEVVPVLAHRAVECCVVDHRTPPHREALGHQLRATGALGARWRSLREPTRRARSIRAPGR